jgi:hypothetical protein
MKWTDRLFFLQGAKLLRTAAWMGILASMFFGFFQPVAAAQMDQSCRQRLDSFRQEENWHRELVDPVLTSQAEIDARLDLYTPLHACLKAYEPDGNPELAELYTLLEYFLIFAGGYQTPPDGSQLHLIDLALSEDRGVQVLRDEAGLEPPPGYVFVRTYTSRSTMPDRVRQIFQNPEVAGVTIYTRYIAVLDEMQSTLQQELLRREALPRTVSHELIHAYVHSVIPLEDLGRLPKWYNEGLAIYFSGSGENHTLVTPNSVLLYTTSAEYQLYRDNFNYLENRLGRDQLLDLVRQSIEQVNPDRLYEGMGIEDERYLQMFAQGWRQQQVRTRRIASLTGAALLGLLVVWMVPPGVTCTCGYHAHKKSFRSGQCPRCRRPVDLSGYNVHREARVPFRTCQVCSRAYWLWNTGKVRRLPTGTPVWVEQLEGIPLEQPESRPVKLICEDCHQRAVEIAGEVRQHQQEAWENARSEAARVYESWLSRAPHVSIWFQQGLDLFTYTEALDRFVDAALHEEFPGMMEQAPTFRFRPFAAHPRDFKTSPPSGYENVLIRQIEAGSGSTVLLGTVRQFPENQVGIHWAPEETGWLPGRLDLIE